MKDLKKWLEYFDSGVEIAVDKDYIADELFSTAGYKGCMGFSDDTDEDVDKAWAEYNKMKNFVLDTENSDTIIIKIKEPGEDGKANIKIASTSGLEHEGEFKSSEETSKNILIALASAFGYEPAELFNFEDEETKFNCPICGKEIKR